MTKADKLGRQQARQAMRQVAQDPLLASRQASLLVMLFSTLSRIGVEDLQRAVESLLTGATVDWAAMTRSAGRNGAHLQAPRPSRAPGGGGGTWDADGSRRKCPAWPAGTIRPFGLQTGGTAP